MISFLELNTTPIVGFLTLVSNILFVLVILVIAAHSTSRAKLYGFVHKYILELLFFGVLSAVIGSLIYSEIIGFPPCDLCWYQRICMYPQLLILSVALFKRDKNVIDYLIPFSVIGALIALYQSFVQWGFFLGTGPGCVSAGGECARVYFTEYSYITIPFMSLTVFVYILSMKFIYYKKNKNG